MNLISNMIIDDIKKHSVIVGCGSGCLFQPMTNDYTYILTAKHLFFETKEDERGSEYEEEYPDGTQIDIKRFIQKASVWEEEAIPFIIVKGDNYFPHEDENTDLAILKVEPKIEGFDKICTSSNLEPSNELLICGSPSTFRQNKPGERYTNYSIERIISSNNNVITAQVDAVLNQNNIEGMSGGAIVKIVENHIVIVGIQSKMANGTNFQAGQVSFVPIKLFKQITDTLVPLLPFHLKCFSFLKDDAFNLNAGFADENILFVKNFLKNKTNNVIESTITPIAIKNHFKSRLLMYNQQDEVLNSKGIWIIWLEFLTILNLLKDEDLTEGELENIFNSTRLIWTNTTGDWSDELTNMVYSDYKGLKKNGVVIVGISTTPADGETYLIENKIPHIATAIKTRKRELDRNLLQIDEGISFPLDDYKFVHIEYFKKKAIISKHLEYAEIIDDNILLEKLRTEYKILTDHE